MAQLFAGTSGFAYSQWKPAFYPEKLPAKQFLQYYASRLNCVEINYTFRRLPSQSTLENWVTATPAGFVFCLKAHMRITHILRLQDSSGFTELFFRAVDPLRVTARLGPILFQLPPQFQCDPAVLTNFLRTLPDDLRYAFEFRHASWLDSAVYKILEEHNVCLCLAESERMEIPEVVTADFVYFRLRKSEYSAQDRGEIADKAAALLAEGKDVYAFFKHEESPAGALYAEELLAKPR
ncbi:MAG: DUF72 domain-containing protein [Acidobacteria bacterium]|nr:DUF72 domain-containing protein [Acidobacteriota bacterium]